MGKNAPSAEFLDDIEAVRQIFVEEGVQTQVMNADGVLVPMNMDVAHDVFLGQSGFDAGGENDSIFHESGHFLSNSIDGSPRSEVRSNLFQSVIMRVEDTIRNQRPLRIKLGNDLLAYPPFENLLDYTDSNRDLGIQYWKGRDAWDRDEDKATKFVRWMFRIKSEPAHPDAGLFVNRYDINYTIEELHDVYEQAKQADELFVLSTGYAAYEMPAYVYRDMPIAFMGVQAHQDHDNGPISFQPLPDETRDRLVTRLRQKYPERAARIDRLHQKSEPSGPEVGLP